MKTYLQGLNNMEPLKPGERIALISKNDNGRHISYLIGYGIYDGFFEIPYSKRLDKIGKQLAKRGGTHCRFHLDNGCVLFDYECWFMAEDRYKEVFINDEYKEGWRVVHINKKSKH